MRRLTLFSALFLFPYFLFSQGDDENSRGWGFELGMRTTTSFFEDAGAVAPGFGGQFRVQPTDRLNTEWYMDYMQNDISGKGRRQTHHIGWSVMFYLLEDNSSPFKPYLLAGHCFDHAKVIPRVPEGAEDLSLDSRERWSSALQLGAGAHYELTDHFDLSLAAQYMNHLGNELGYEEYEDHIRPVEGQEGLSVEGHFLMTLSMNVKIIRR